MKKSELRKLVREEVQKIVEQSFSEIKDEIKNASINTKATGGGYGPFIKKGKNNWVNKKTNSNMTNDALASFIGTFNDFNLE